MGLLTPSGIQINYVEDFNIVNYFYIDGNVLYRNDPAEREVYLFNRTTMSLVDYITSSGTDGYFYMTTPYYQDLHNIICKDDSSTGGYSDILISKVKPELI